MPGRCCLGGPVAGRPARRLSNVAASILPGALLVLLPKCPLCLAAWLTALTGAAFTASSAVRARGMLVVFWVAAVALWAVRRSAAFLEYRDFGNQHRTSGNDPGNPLVPVSQMRRNFEAPGSSDSHAFDAMEQAIHE
jgi:hypothetical protein